MLGCSGYIIIIIWTLVRTASTSTQTSQFRQCNSFYACGADAATDSVQSLRFFSASPWRISLAESKRTRPKCTVCTARCLHAHRRRPLYKWLRAQWGGQTNRRCKSQQKEISTLAPFKARSKLQEKNGWNERAHEMHVAAWIDHIGNT